MGGKVCGKVVGYAVSEELGDEDKDGRFYLASGCYIAREGIGGYDVVVGVAVLMAQVEEVHQLAESSCARIGTGCCVHASECMKEQVVGIEGGVRAVGVEF